MGSRARTLILVVLLAAASMGLSGLATAAPQPESALAEADAGTIYGGTTQSADPTRYDYVPPAVETNGLVAPQPSGFATPQSASSGTLLSAFRYEWLGFSIPVPGLQWHYHLAGRGLSITNQHTRWVPTLANNVRLCNWQVAYQNRLGKTRIFSTRWSPMHAGCTWGTGTDTMTRDYKVRTGMQCARLYVNGYFRGEHCHNVFP